MNLGGTIRLNKLGVCIITFLAFVCIFYVTSSSEDEKKNLVSLKKLLIAAVEAAVKGGKEVSLVYSHADINERSKGKTKEGANDPVTDADVKSNCVMYFSFTHTFPKVKVVSEEENSHESACLAQQSLELDVNVLRSEKELEDEEVAAEDVTVWIDPLDATQEFTEKLLEYVTTMVCVAVNGEPVIGVIHFPFGEEPKTTWAWVGKAVSSEILHKKQSKSSDNTNPTVIISRSHSGEALNRVKSALGENIPVISAGGAGYKSLEVASGNITAYIHTTAIKKWDICAGNAVIKALGGQMTTLKNNNIGYKLSTDTDKINTEGILATLEQHTEFIDKLMLKSP